ncbi:GNAT family N-acetyltransferase [Streptomyces thermodiastaticus]|jgi:RimJ/RimL family protein N-acetyltransferase|uniref:GNAT family N-acetyltransferase n=1 Tax=Streptomyces thermodiastaticus TaxID=44061 RepID=UPI0016725A71|nr:GNAT family N-acetyltransferase [Streptomyces thermodiastaticus]MCE7553419.1 GNAT family N-acetyltransferase [Streptomyces thermodiastaticus]GHF96849.1 N-acetyltransferase [Streptomyces thermodiastaticus]
MTGLGPVVWPPAPVRTGRLVLRASEARDRQAFVELVASPDVQACLGGPRPRDELERVAPEVPGRRLGTFVAELGYAFLPGVWGHGYAADACAAVLDWFAGVCAGEPVVLCTQTANGRSLRLAAKLGFTEVERFEEFGAEQWLGVWSPVGAKLGRTPRLASRSVLRSTRDTDL